MQGVIALSELEQKDVLETEVDTEVPDVKGPVEFPKLGVIIISVILGLIVILAIIIRIINS